LEFLRLRWSDIEEMCRKLAGEMEEKGLAGSMLVGISRGGLVPLRLLSDHFPESEISTMAVRFYVEIGKRKGRPEITSPVQGDVRGRRVVLIDDIADTGESLLAAVRHLKARGAEEVIVATLLKKPWSKVKPELCARETSAWVIFPWEVQETLREIIARAGSKAEAEEKLAKAGIEEEEYRRELRKAFGA